MDIAAGIGRFASGAASCTPHISDHWSIETVERVAGK